MLNTLNKAISAISLGVGYTLLSDGGAGLVGCLAAGLLSAGIFQLMGWVEYKLSSINLLFIEED